LFASKRTPSPAPTSSSTRPGGQLEDQPATDEHHEDLLLEPDRAAAEAAAAPRRGDPGGADQLVDQVLVASFSLRAHLARLAAGTDSARAGIGTAPLNAQ
jgi:hypothetical protein